MPHARVPLVPKDPKGALRVLVVGRISTVHQNVENIDASYRFVGEFFRRMYDGPIDYKHLGEQGSGSVRVGAEHFGQRLGVERADFR